MGRTLLVTHDFPPEPGGIQSFVYNLAVRQPADSLVVYTSAAPGADAFDRDQPFEVVRERTRMLLPTPAVTRRAVEIARGRGCDRVWFGTAAPLGLLTAELRDRAGVGRAVALTHGRDIAWAALPVARSMLRRVGRHVDVVTYLGEYTRSRLATVLPRLERLVPGVDTEVYTPGADGSAVRRRHGLADRPVVVCVSRLIPRKGQDVLIRAMPLVHRSVPDAVLLIVGDGPDRDRLAKTAQAASVPHAVVFTGAVPREELPAHYAAGDVYAMPCRTRRAGLDVEGLGIVYLEASACGLPVVAGDSGGAPDAVLDGETGYVVDGRDVPMVAGRLAALLRDRALAAELGRAGRAWVESRWRWDTQAARLAELLDGDPAAA
ncbi:glycosyl transferase family 1 [Sphaerisporangium krabiense]|uniref:Phosphatidylinositol alpha-1,6-mannosyltransferase n=1 Tax=Sphaerisporangium krabiense TaxID=763782 RepID=A0A7W9DQX4_9ACTN|nr:glycosyltransferase family 4 protein [Sphaerisporangium krabiense]MBB5627504.1 phosphatidylinositol alpha-1,6-mannosyltransferase [Sphaerisporangium krabiense]GII64357.1 glycosyl transferase family 1 [Sphaerisporangium krabiense]